MQTLKLYEECGYGQQGTTLPLSVLPSQGQHLDENLVWKLELLNILV